MIRAAGYCDARVANLFMIGFGGFVMSEPWIGQLMCVGYNFAQRGWANCDGQLLPISQNSALFSLYGTMYGGDGRTTFALPDLRGRVPIHLGQGPGLPSYNQGQRGGNYETTQPPRSHAHAVQCENQLQFGCRRRGGAGRALSSDSIRSHLRRLARDQRVDGGRYHQWHDFKHWRGGWGHKHAAVSGAPAGSVRCRASIRHGIDRLELLS